MWLLYAAAAAFCFGMRAILYQWSSRKPLDRNLMLLGVFLCGTILTLAVNAFLGQPWTRGAMTGMAMGTFSFVANMAMYRGFAVGKASLVAIITALPPVVVAAGAYALWRETLNVWQFGALCVILLGIIVIRYSNDLKLSNLNGAQWAVLAMLGFAANDLSSKQSQLWSAEVLPTLTTMFATGSLLFFAVWFKMSVQPKRRAADLDSPDGTASAARSAGATVNAVAETKADPGRPPRWPAWRTLLWGMTVGLTNASGMMLILPAFKLGAAGLVSAVIATNVLLILLFTRVFLKERFTRAQLLGIGVTIAGVLLLRLME